MSQRLRFLIKLANPKASYLAHKDEIDQAISKVLNSGNYILGDEVKKFENNFSKYIGVKHAIGVASGTDALFLSMKALGIGRGDEVITVSNTSVATVSAIVMTGATPVLIDIEREHFTINPSLIEKAITKRTRVILPVHLYGNPANMREIMRIARKHNLHVVEDCAQATGAKHNSKRVGSIGTLGCFSFYPTKNLGCFGDGGMITTNNSKLAKKLRLLRQYGWEKRYISKVHGYNSRLDEIQAAILNVKLEYLDRDNLKRKYIAMSYGYSPYNPDSVYHLYVVRSRRREKFIRYFESKGMQTGIHYPMPIHLQPGYKDLVRVSGSMEVTESMSKQIFSIPMYPELSNTYEYK